MIVNMIWVVLKAIENLPKYGEHFVPLYVLSSKFCKNKINM